VSPGLTESQLSDLRSAGASLDAKDMETAASLQKRGFTGDDFVAAYREHNAMKSMYPELTSYGRDMVETIAVAQKLGLGDNDKYWFVWDRHQRNRTLTEAYNEKVRGGPGLTTFGAVTTGTGLVLLIVGYELYSTGHKADSNGDWYDRDTNTGRHSMWMTYTGEALAITGGVVMAAGIPFTIWGLYRWGTHLPAGTLDSAPADQIQSLRASASDRRKATVQWSLSPSIGPSQAGLGLTAVF
jgi:hypothetical protein